MLAKPADLDVVDFQVIEHHCIGQGVVAKDAVSGVVCAPSADQNQILNIDTPGVLDRHTCPGARQDGCPPVPERTDDNWCAGGARLLRREAQVPGEGLPSLEKHSITGLKVSVVDPFDSAPRSFPGPAGGGIIPTGSDKIIASKHRIHSEFQYHPEHQHTCAGSAKAQAPNSLHTVWPDGQVKSGICKPFAPE